MAASRVSTSVFSTSWSRRLPRKPNGRLELPRRIKPGSELVRTWNRRTYRVMVLEKGFAYDGKTFAEPLGDRHRRSPGPNGTAPGSLACAHLESADGGDAHAD